MGHSSIDHRAGEYVRGDVSTNQAENFFSQLKRSIDGTHHHVSVEHLNRYLAEFGFRHSTRKVSDTERMAMVGQHVGGKRLTYRKPTCRAIARPRWPRYHSQYPQRDSNPHRLVEA